MMYPKQIITVTWGQEVFTPIPYNTITVGPFSKTLEFRGDATDQYIEQETQATYDKLAAYADRIKKEKLKSFLKSLKDVAAEVQNQKGK